MDISRQARGFVTRPSAKRAEELLNLSTNQPTTMTGLLFKGNMAYRDTIHFTSDLTEHQIIYNYYHHTKSVGKIWGTICLNRVR